MPNIFLDTNNNLYKKKTIKTNHLILKHVQHFHKLNEVIIKNKKT